MDIFSQIEGSSGENLGSALLSYLMFNSYEIRDSMLSLFSDKSPVGPISCESHFACQAEYQTKSGDDGGRLDLLIQLDDVVVGIENKFFAVFRDNQPGKYIETLNEVGEFLGKINHREVRTVLFVLCPESRKDDSVRRISGIDNANIITWEKIIDELRGIEEISNPVAKIVRDEFMGYLKRHFSFINDFKRKLPHLLNAFPEYGTPLQAELVGKIWSVFPKPGRRLSYGKTWLGYYFFSDPAINEKGWFGFVPREELGCNTENQAELIIASTYKPSLSESFKPTEMKDKCFIGEPENTKAWIIRFDRSWNRLDKWREKLIPFWDAVKND